jgi:hypothetical protein
MVLVLEAGWGSRSSYQSKSKVGYLYIPCLFLSLHLLVMTQYLLASGWFLPRANQSGIAIADIFAIFSIHSKFFGG